MDLGCSICQESFNASAICVATKCGHVFHKTCVSQWVVNSRTCPSCRAVCQASTLLRIYFTTSLADLSQRDVDSLTDKLVAAEEKATKYKSENDSLKAKLAKIAANEKKLKTCVNAMDEMVKSKETLIKLQSSQLKDYGAQKARADAKTKEAADLSSKLAQMSHIEVMMKESVHEVEAMVATETNVKTLSFMVVSLKRELAAAEAKKSEMFSSNCCLNNKVKSQTQKIGSMEEKLMTLESEFDHIQAQLRERIREAEQNRATNGESNRRSTIITQRPTESTTPSLATPQAQPMDQSDSPYLRLAASNVGLTPLMRTGKAQVMVNRPMNGTHQLSIFANSKSCVVRPAAGKENPQQVNAGAAKSDRYKIENRLKSGALKRPAPYNPK